MNSIAKWFQEHVLGRDLSANEIVDYPFNNPEWFKNAGEAYIRDLAFFSCANIMARAVSKCEFKTFVGDVEIKEEEYYLWNYEPNINQCSSEFMQKWIVQLYLNNEALIIEHNGQMLIADSFVKKEYDLYEDIFEGVTVKDFTFNKKFMQSEVLYFKLSSKNMKKVIDGIYGAYSKLIKYGMESYQKSRGTKGIMDIDTMQSGDPNKAKEMQTQLNRQFKLFAESENGILGVPKGYDYKSVSDKTYSNEETRDIRAMIDDVCDFTARGFSIPPALLNGKVEGTSQATDHLLTFAVDPLCDMLQEEITRKRYGYAGFKRGAYIKIDTRNIKHIDLLDVAVAIDKLIASGAFCINDIRKLSGDQPIDAQWAYQHFMTKNYATVSDLLNTMGGEGEKIECQE